MRLALSNEPCSRVRRDARWQLTLVSLQAKFACQPKHAALVRRCLPPCYPDYWVCDFRSWEISMIRPPSGVTHYVDVDVNPESSSKQQA